MRVAVHKKNRAVDDGCSVLGGGQGRYGEDRERRRGTAGDVFGEGDQRVRRHGEECHCLPAPAPSLFFFSFVPLSRDDRRVG